MTPLFATLECLDDPQPHDAVFNMAADEALLDGLTEHALLRIYRWRRPAVSFGYFDHAAPVLLGYPGRDPIRRWTGGGIVEHGEDFTYSLLVPRTHALTSCRAEESYRVVHEVLAKSLTAAGVVLPVGLEAGLPPRAAEIARACFANPVPHDLLMAGQKIAGAAQRRTRRGWLHQGSILLTDNSASIYEQLRATLPANLSGSVLPRRMRPEEVANADALATGKYGTDAWLRRV